jgi:3-oxoacyl-[acyl-carrier protein] reductase
MTFADLAGKVVLVTGGSTGIGAAAARAFGAAGARVGVHYNRSEAAAAAVAGDIRARGGEAALVAGDLAERVAARRIVDRTVEAFGRIDVLVNNAGSLLERRPVAEADDDLFDRIVELNAGSVFAACRAAVPHFRRQGRGNIINVTSIAARHGGGPGAVLYASAKAFVSTFTRGLAKELVRDGIRVNAVAPGVILTPFHDRFTTEAQMRSMVGTIPMGRPGTPEECAGAFLYLASDAMSGYVTGQVLEVNGGQLMP